MAIAISDSGFYWLLGFLPRHSFSEFRLLNSEFFLLISHHHCMVRAVGPQGRKEYQKHQN